MADLGKSITIAPWPDTLVERLGHEPMSSYVETYYLPVLGPTSTWLYRRLGMWVAVNDSLTVDVDDLARSLGVGGRRTHIDRPIERLCTFHAARWNNDVLEVRRKLPTLSVRFIGQLPESLRVRHERDTILRHRAERVQVSA